MMKKNAFCLLALNFMLVLLISACASTQTPELSPEEQAARLRAAQSKTYTLNKDILLRAIVANFQDLGFVVAEVDYDSGLVVALQDTYTARQSFGDFTGKTGVMKINVVASHNNNKTFLVRANAERDIFTPNLNFVANFAINDIKVYQDFFTSLDKAIFIETNLGVKK